MSVVSKCNNCLKRTNLVSSDDVEFAVSVEGRVVVSGGLVSVGCSTLVDESVVGSTLVDDVVVGCVVGCSTLVDDCVGVRPVVDVEPAPMHDRSSGSH